MFKPRKAQIPVFNASVANAIARHAWRIAKEETAKIAERSAQAMKLRLRAQAFESFDAHPLAQSTIDKKERLGLSLETMISTGNYVDKIKVQRQSLNLGRAFTFYVGHAEQDFAKNEYTGKIRKDVPLNKVAMWNELGTENIPARPHWKPALEDLREQAVKDREHIKQLILRDMRNKLGIRK